MTTSEFTLEASTNSSYGRFTSETMTYVDSENPFSEYTERFDRTVALKGFNDGEITIIDELKSFQYIVINKWDNILGPHLIKCYAQSKFVDEKLINYVNMHVLSGEIDESFPVGGQDRERKLLFLYQQKIIILAIIFNVRSGLADSLFCLSFVFPLERASKITKLWSFLQRSSKCIKETIYQAILMPGNLRGVSEKLGSMLLKLDIITYDLIYYSLDQVSRPLHYFENSIRKSDFLRFMYQGVLRCAGYSLVIGMSTQLQQIEQVCLMLSYIMSSEDQAISIFPLSHHTQYHSYVYHQTLMYESHPGEILDSMQFHREIGKNDFPLAIIDVTQSKVFITSTIEKYFDKESRSKTTKFKLKEVKSHGQFVGRLVEKMAMFHQNGDFLKRIGDMGLTEINLKVDLLSKFCRTHVLSTVKQTLKYDPFDFDIFIAWACRRDSKLKEKLFAREQQTEFNELAQIFVRR